MYRLREDNSSKPLVGNDVYEGFAKDLADMLAERLNFTCNYLHTDLPLTFNILTA